MKNLILLLSFIMSLSGLPAHNAVRKTLPVSGTWVNLAYQDERNRYTNPIGDDNESVGFWENQIYEFHEMGIEYLVLMAVANEGKAYYPSLIMPHAYPDNSSGPLTCIMETAEKLGMKVFLSCGWAENQDDNLGSPEIMHRQIEIMEELASIYGKNSAFYGWYLPVESSLAPVLPENAAKDVNVLARKAKSLKPDAKVMISPFGIYGSDFDNPLYEARISSLEVDIIAYQDEVGCVREKFPLPGLCESWKRLRAIHDRTGVAMWANCETFTWDGPSNSRASALVPAAFSRFLAQQVAATQGGAEKIVSFIVQGMFESPESDCQCGQPYWSNKMYADYMAWLAGADNWTLLENTFNGRAFSTLKTNADAGYADKLNDNIYGGVSPDDTSWVHLGEGHHVYMICNTDEREIRQVALRFLDCPSHGIHLPEDVSVWVSTDGVKYDLLCRKVISHYPNDLHDAWVELVLLNNLDTAAPYVKVTLDSTGNALLDEILVNPEIR